MQKFFLLLTFLFLYFIPVKGQQDHVTGQVMVQVNPGVSIELLKKDIPGLNLEKHLSQDWGMFLLKFDPSKINENVLLNLLRGNKYVRSAQFNHYATLRADSFPNDTRFPSMWGLHNNGTNGTKADADIDAVEAWDITPGGLTSTGDSIVVAVLDGGFYLSHNDLNFWKNYNEIPNNGIDDDSNGYIDDFNGWNEGTNNDSITSDSHGTHVAGTVGAKGNNSLGVTGVNINVKVMPVQLGSYSESEVVSAYNYIYNQRKLYNQTNGAKGAFVVATNASFGINKGQPADYPLWCAVYDSLGSVGILSAGATANANWDIDEVGDIPTACESPYLISVTNTTSSDTKNSGAAYGKTTIDLGAPGTGIWSTYPNNGYNSITGTSMATPHVAGAIALMYAAACPRLINEYKSNPDSVALVMREFLLSNVDIINALKDITVSGGRLNIYKSLMAILRKCDAPEPPLIIKSCASDSVFHIFLGQRSGNATNVYWFDSKFDTAPIFTGDTFLIPTTGSSVYYVSTYNSANETYSKKIPVFVKGFKNTFTSPDTTINSKTVIQLNAFGGISYSWSPGAFLNDSTISDPVTIPLDTTTAFVVTVLTSDSCSYTDTIKVTVRSDVSVRKNENNMAVNLYPNPFNSSFTITFSKQLNENDKASFLIYDVLGKEIKNIENISGNKTIVNKEKMAPGMYFYKFSFGNETLTGKISLVE